jgi:hypothetical protein
MTTTERLRKCLDEWNAPDTRQVDITCFMIFGDPNRYLPALLAVVEAQKKALDGVAESLEIINEMDIPMLTRVVGGAFIITTTQMREAKEALANLDKETDK